MGNIMNWDTTIWAEKDLQSETVEEPLKMPKDANNPECAPKKKVSEVPIWFKANLTLEEAAAYFGIGINKLREMTNKKNCSFVLFIGRKRLVKRRQLEEYLAKCCVI